MDNSMVIVIYIPFMLVSLIVLAAELSAIMQRRRSILLALMCVCSIGCFACEIPTLFAISNDMIAYLWNIALIFIGFLSPLLLVALLDFYRPSFRLSRLQLILLFAIPTLNAVVALTSLFHPFIREITVVSIAPVREVSSQYGIWFWVHTVYCYALSLSILVLILVSHIRLPKLYRLSSTMMVIGVILALSGNVVTLLGITPVNMDLTFIAVSITILFFHLALISKDQSIFVRLSRGQVFQCLEEFILVLSDNGRVADYNPGAKEWFSSMGIELETNTLETIIDALRHKGASIQPSPENKPGMDIQLIHDGFPMVLNLRTHEITDDKDNSIGSVAIFTDVTENRALIDRLNAKAGIDPLTGLANRIAYEGARNRLDRSEHYPLSVILCDVNDLKVVNDTLGHRYGDMMLRIVGEVIEMVCPRAGFAARIGGDEFLFLLPNTDRHTAMLLIQKAQGALREYTDLPFTIHAAMGAATKQSAQDSLDDIIASADTRMYENKKWLKGFRHQQ